MVPVKPDRHRLRTALLVTLATLTVPATAVGLWAGAAFHDSWAADVYVRPAYAALWLSVILGAAGASFLAIRRPMNRCSLAAVALVVTFAAWWISVTYWRGDNEWRAVVPLFLVYSLRPLLFFLVLAFPVGRLDRASRRLFGVLVAVSSALFLLEVVVDNGDGGLFPSITLWHSSTWTLLSFSTWWDVGAFVVAAAVLVVVRRRTLRFSGPGRSIAAPAFWAALVATSADFFLIGSGPLRDLQFHNGLLTPTPRSSPRSATTSRAHSATPPPRCSCTTPAAVGATSPATRAPSPVVIGRSPCCRSGASRSPHSSTTSQLLPIRR